MPRHRLLEIAVELLAGFDRQRCTKDHLGELGGDIDHVLGAARLHDDRPSLRGPRHIERPAHREELAFVIERMQPLRIEKLPAGLVADEGVVVPAVPQRGDDIGEFAGAFVALAVLEVLIAAEILRFFLLARRDQVPAGAAAADMVEGGELARHVIRLVVARGRGGDEPDMARRAGQRRKQGDRLEIGDVLRRAAQRVNMRLSHADIVGEEDHVELGTLGGLRQLAIVRDIDPGVGLGFLVPP